MPLFVAAVAVPVSASSGTDRNKFVNRPILQYGERNVDLKEKKTGKKVYV